MDERRAAVLQAVVESFIDNAQPVGSQTVLQSAGLDVSAATIRNDLLALEVEGFLVKPHPSAGRIPTEMGYRCFVDQLEPDQLESGQLDTAQIRQVKAFFEHAQGQIEERLADTSKLLSTLTDYTAMVVAPSHEREIIRSANLVDLGAGRLVLVIVTSSGAVERCPIVPTAPADKSASEASAAANAPSGNLPVDPPVLDEASRCLAQALVGTKCGDVLEVAPAGNLAVDVLIKATIEAWRKHDIGERALYIGGTADIAEQFNAMSTVTSVLRVLEEQLLVVSLLRSLVDRGLSVAIGSETGVLPLAECAVVASPYVVDGEPVGSIGVVGPTRMDYPKALATVNLVGERLGASLAAARS